MFKFKWTEVLEQTKAGEWRTVRRYDRKSKMLATGCVLALLALVVVGGWGIYKFSQIEVTEKIEEKIVAEEIPIEEKFAIPYTFEASPDAAGFDGEKFARLKKRHGTFAVYESLHEGNKELAEFSVSADINAGTFIIKWGAKESDDASVLMTRADAEKLKSFIEEGTRVIVE